MAIETFWNAKLFFGKFDLTGFSNRIDVGIVVPPLPKSTLGKRQEIFNPGILQVTARAGGIVDFNQNSIDDFLAHNFGIGFDDIPFTAAPQNGALAGQKAVFMKAMLSQYQLGLQHGQIPQYSIELPPTDAPFVDGLILTDRSAAITGTNSGTPRQLGALADSTRQLWAVIHVLAKTGTSPTLDAKIQSAPTGGFGSPTDRIAFPQFTAEGYSMLNVVGPITDEHWRFSWAIGGSSSPSFTVFVAGGIITN